MANDAGGYFARDLVERPGMSERKPRSKAMCSVDSAGENSAAWEKATSSLGVAEWMAPLQWWGTGVSGTVTHEQAAAVGWANAGVGSRVRCQRPVLIVRSPRRMTIPSRRTRTDAASKVTWHPASQSCPMESRDAVVRAGTIWTWRADNGSWGMSSSASCVEYMIEPLGLVIPMGLVVGRLLMTCAETVQKCAVQPLSAIANDGDGSRVGGPTWKQEEQQ